MAHCREYADNMTDPDIMGFGVLLSFIFPVLASHIIMIMAYITRKANPEQFKYMDSLIHERLCAHESKISHLRGVKYEQLLLTLSDQLSVTSFALLIALYTQIRSLSSFSFSVGVALAFLSFGVHTSCLVGLTPYLRSHKRQANLRVGFLTLLVICLMISNMLNYFIPNRFWIEILACAVRNAQPNALSIYSAIASNWFFAKSYYDALSRFYGLYPAADGFLRLLCVTEGLRKDFRALLQRRVQKELKSQATMLKTLSDEHSTQVNTLRIVVWVLFKDLLDSIFWKLFQDMSFTVYLLYSLISAVVDVGEEERESLLEPKFGQILPLILFSVFIINVLDARGETDSVNAVMMNELSGNSLESVETQNAFTSSITEGPVPIDELSNTAESTCLQCALLTDGEIPLTNRVVRRWTTELRQTAGRDQLGTTGRVSFTDLSNFSISTPNRAMTFLMESGADPTNLDLKAEDEDAIKAKVMLQSIRLEVAHKAAAKSLWCAWVVLWTAIVVLFGVLVLLVFYGTWVGLATFTIILIWIFCHVIWALWQMHRIRIDRITAEKLTRARANASARRQREVS